LAAITLAAASVALAQNEPIVLLDHPQGGVVTADFEQSTVSSSPYQYKPARHWGVNANNDVHRLRDAATGAWEQMPGKLKQIGVLGWGRPE
jgi:hypothetical protein